MIPCQIEKQSSLLNSFIFSHLYLVFVFIQINAQEDPVRGITFAKQNARKML